MKAVFDRTAYETGETSLLHTGRSANAYLRVFHHGGTAWVVKDFRPCWPVLRHVWGTAMTRHEWRILKRLDGVEGTPQHVFRLDRYALCYHYIEGTTIREADPARLTSDYFRALEDLVVRMHERRIVHLDLRYRRNILITVEDQPAILDFQTAVRVDRLPMALQKRLHNIDRSGVYKQWLKRDPDSIDAERMEFLRRINRHRRFWLLRGYAGIKRNR